LKASAPSPTGMAEISPGVVLDGRLCVVHKDEGWLAAADLHHGYELTKRHQGALLPFWGMEALGDRLAAAIADHQPRDIILCGDIVDGHGSHAETAEFLDSLRAQISGELICIAGNHDRGQIRKLVKFCDTYETEGFAFHHGHESPALPPEKTWVSGHLHPTVSLHDGAGLSLKVPALLQIPPGGAKPERWVLPAFSPWAGGRDWTRYDLPRATQPWVCTPKRVFPLNRQVR
jgi:metallophosphoesterase superfamily enzyme